MLYGVVVLCLLATVVTSLEVPESAFKELRHATIRVDNFKEHTVYSVLREGEVVQRIRLSDTFDQGMTLVDQPDERRFTLRGIDQTINFQLMEDRSEFTLVKVSRVLDSTQSVSDCIDLETGRLNWYGGMQTFHQYWPIEKFSLQNYSYVAKQQDNVGLAERYWLNSAGSFVYVDDAAPLFINQNVKDSNELCLTVQNALPYNVRTPKISFVYYIGIGRDSKQAHREAVRNFLKKPTGTPDERMVEHPIWSTWARYKVDINESVVERFANEIISNGFNNSQLEIDDDWEVCYGALTFRTSKFPNIKNFTDRLKARGFRVTLWVHPFINKGCEPWYSEAKRLGYLVVDHRNNTDTQWWNSRANESAHIDFTKKAAADWYVARLRKLQQDAGIDSYKFDAGETSWTPPDPVLNSTIEGHPNAITKAYVRTVSQFGRYVEVRTGQGTQDVPIFVRMIDKDSEWNYENGLPTLITTMFQLNLVGYPFVLPDMIGGNGYNNRLPTKELFIRWLQANTFMPSIQFSYVPWDYDRETIEISRNFTRLHATVAAPLINNLFKKAAATGEPVNVPIWWVDPKDKVAHQIADEFLLGEDVLVAPVVQDGARARDIYLPRGTWHDPNDPNTHVTIKGPKWLMNYPAPLNVLPYFYRQH